MAEGAWPLTPFAPPTPLTPLVPFTPFVPFTPLVWPFILRIGRGRGPEKMTMEKEEQRTKGRRWGQL